MSFKRYPKYKDSGVQWLGAVPEHWGISRLKNLFMLMNRPPQEDDEIVTAFRDGEVTLRSNRRVDGFTNALQEHGYQRIQKGDLVIHAMDAFAGAIGVSDSDGKSSPVYSACTPRSSHTHSAYFGRLLRHMAMTGYINALAKGIRERSTEFRWKEAANVGVSVPSYDEQTRIVEFLDRETSKIDALMAEQERLIELLKEKRQAVISHAVTKGLNPHAKLKPSGIEWLGDVPAHWSVVPVSYRYSVQLGKMLDSAKISGAHLRPYLRVFDVQWGAVNVDDLPMMDFDEDDRSRFSLLPGDLLVNEGGSYPGRSALWNAPIAECYYQKALHRMRPINNADDSARFLYYVMSCAANQGVFTAGGNETTIEHLPAEKLRRYRFPFPSLDEQLTIANFLDAELMKTDSLSSEALRAIDLLQERRSALISAAVTGQIDVRAL